jgi:hypothetical protein
VSISSLSPESATAGSSDLRLSITGGGFSEPQGHHRTWVLWDFVGLPTSVLATTVKSKAELTVLVPATLLAAPGVARLTVESGDPMGDEFARSRSLDFHIVP